MKQLQKGLHFALLFLNHLTLTMSITTLFILRFVYLDMSEARFLVEFWQLYLIVALSAAGIVICAKIEIVLRGE